jgi:hypothetical protein
MKLRGEWRFFQEIGTFSAQFLYEKNQRWLSGGSCVTGHEAEAPRGLGTRNYRTAVEANFLTMASSSLRSLSFKFVE